MKSGNAFVVPLEADEDIDPERLPEGDVFVDRKNLGFALDGDTVAVKVISSEKDRAAQKPRGHCNKGSAPGGGRASRARCASKTAGLSLSPTGRRI